MKKALALISGLCLVLGFQNCAQNQMQSADAIGDSDISNVNLVPVGSGDSSSGSGSSASSGKVTFVEVPNISDENSASQQKATVITPYRLVVSLQTGSIQLMDNSNNVLQKRCLTETNLEDLKGILNGASICAAQVANADICAMKYTPGYASLYVNEQRVNLGEQQDSCGRGRKDLCGNATDIFQSYVSHLKQHWTEMNCQ